jgi:dipeptidyl aminopeptidase/acylaminoacyl peptidase
MNEQQYLNQILNLPQMIGPMVSPDGRRVAWSWVNAGPGVNVYGATTDGRQPPIQFSDTLDGTFLVGWTPDSQALIVEQDRDGNERAQLFRIDWERPLTMIPLTEENPNYFIRGGDLHPDGRTLFYGANVDLATGQEIEPTCLIRHDLHTGERTTLAWPAKPLYTWPQLSPDGRHILYHRADRLPGGRQIWLMGSDGRDDREIFSAGDRVKAFGRWLPDSQQILILAESDSHSRLGLWSLADEAKGLRWLLDDPQRNIEGGHAPLNSDRLIVLELRQARLKASLLDPQTGAETFLPDLPGNLRPLAPVGNDRDGRWIGFYFSSQQPDDLVLFDPAQPDPALFVSLSRVWERTALTPDDLTAAEDFHWQSVDGLAIHGWLYRAAVQPAKGTIVYVHGGPTGHSSDRISLQPQFFARQGFNVLDPNYRGSTGYNLAFREAIKEDGWGGREQADIRTGIEALVAAGIAEPGKVGITGTSYGGYSSWHAITHWRRPTLAAAAPICGMTDLVVDYETTRPDLRPYSEEMLGGRPDEVPDRYFERSPINFVHQIEGELLIVQGLQDPNVSPENVRIVREALQKAGVEHQLLAFDDEGHGIIRQENRQKLLLALARFFETAFE